MRQPPEKKSARASRWAYAQKNELIFWQDKQQAAHFTDTYWTWEFSHYGLNLNSFVGQTVLEVGCGPRGVIYFLEGPRYQRIGIEPLAINYRELGYPIHQATCLAGIAESLPARDGSIDVVISNNVLDHSLDPVASLCEMHRVLSDGGRLLLMINVIPWILRSLIPFLDLIDVHHPHHFIMSDVECLLDTVGMQIQRKTLRKGAVGKPKWSRIFLPSQWKYFFAYYVMSTLYIVATKE